MNTGITETSLRLECESLAKDIIDEYEGDMSDIDALREYAQERAHEVADGHQWVIYTYQAKQVCTIAPDSAEEYLEDINGSPFDGCTTFTEVCTRLAYAALYTGVMDALYEQMEALEDLA